MATIREECQVKGSAEEAWAAFCDVGAVHTRLAPGFVTDTKLDGDEARIVTFANGFVAREVFVTTDHAARRFVYSVRSERIAHHNASFQVFDDGDGARIVWIADVLPHAAAETVGSMMAHGVKAMQAALSK